ncbi:hypothetical protein D3C81_1716930 [compost metagenome]
MVSPFQNIDRNSTGKLTDAAIASTSPDRKAMFCFSNITPSTIASRPITSVAIFDTRISSFSLAWPRRNTLA